MATERSFNFFAWSTGITLLVYLAGSVWALVAGEIDFAVFIGAIGAPLGAMTGWAAKSAQVPTQ
jgi:hypothetical protein